ncbi:hypothetical protein IMX07_05650 [bacterium]|nr:hypothetical protein [bacterium]
MPSKDFPRRINRAQLSDLKYHKATFGQDRRMAGEFLNQPGVVFFIAIISLVAIYYTGGLIGARINPGELEVSNTVQGAILALLGLLLGFTFAMALSRYETRRTMVLDESNTLGTAFLRASFVPDPYRIDAQNALREYATARLDFYRAGYDQQRIAAALDRASRLQARLWFDAAAAVKAQPTVATSLFIQSLNDLIDFAAKRRDALDDRIPLTVWATLGAVSILAVFLTGHIERKRFSVLSLVLPIAVAAVLGLIADLDAPRSGSIEVSQQQMLTLNRTLAAVPQRTPGSAVAPNDVTDAPAESLQPPH